MPMVHFEEAMREAISQARMGRWHACPNPTVGAVLLRDGKIVARGYHHRAGEPHAEIMCLKDAESRGISPKGATIFVTLEPCNHTGRTGPCSEALIKAGVARCVIGMRDPNPVAAGGIEKLERHGIEVITGVLEQECKDLTADFQAWVQKRPFVITKLAATLDGRIATRTGHSRWVSSEVSRKAVHALREGIGLAGGAVLVGGGTFRADDPRLTARTQTATRQPVACVVTSALPEDPDEYFLTRERAGETIFFVPEALSESAQARRLLARGCSILPLPSLSSGSLDMKKALGCLWERGCHYVLCEGGGKLALSLLEESLCDRLELYLSPKILADAKATPLFAGRTIATMDEALGLRILASSLSGPDLHLTLGPRAEA